MSTADVEDLLAERGVIVSRSAVTAASGQYYGEVGFKAARQRSGGVSNSPTTLAEIAQVMDDFGAQADDVQTLFIPVDT